MKQKTLKKSTPTKGRNREEILKDITPIHSKVPNDKFYKNYDKIK